MSACPRTCCARGGGRRAGATRELLEVAVHVEDQVDGVASAVPDSDGAGAVRGEADDRVVGPRPPGPATSSASDGPAPGIVRDSSADACGAKARNRSTAAAKPILGLNGPSPPQRGISHPYPRKASACRRGGQCAGSHPEPVRTVGLSWPRRPRLPAEALPIHPHLLGQDRRLDGQQSPTDGHRRVPEP